MCIKEEEGGKEEEFKLNSFDSYDVETIPKMQGDCE